MTRYALLVLDLIGSTQLKNFPHFYGMRKYLSGMLLYVILFPQKEQRLTNSTEECMVCLMAKVVRLYIKHKSQVDEMF